MSQVVDRLEGVIAEQNERIAGLLAALKRQEELSVVQGTRDAREHACLSETLRQQQLELLAARAGTQAAEAYAYQALLGAAAAVTPPPPVGVNASWRQRRRNRHDSIRLRQEIDYLLMDVAHEREVSHDLGERLEAVERERATNGEFVLSKVVPVVLSNPPLQGSRACTIARGGEHGPIIIARYAKDEHGVWALA